MLKEVNLLVGNSSKAWKTFEKLGKYLKNVVNFFTNFYFLLNFWALIDQGSLNALVWAEQI